MRYFVERFKYPSPTVPDRIEETYSSRPLPKWGRSLPKSTTMIHMQTLYPDAVYTTEIITRK